ncbi:Apple-like protein [Artemisia annua]|uniref:Apple-like protein n=1 Tax=Artemisia annua TaxID=35608 RepID=A0A2U1P0I3_ARTAN|nr:Apple-like protein [Artemisia annua]
MTILTCPVVNFNNFGNGKRVIRADNVVQNNEQKQKHERKKEFLFQWSSKRKRDLYVVGVQDIGGLVYKVGEKEDGESTTGFELTKGNSISFEAPSEWTSGRIWGRTGCNFDVSGNSSCTSGDCGTGEVECKGNLYKPPATIAEFSSWLRSWAKTGCIDDLIQRYPSELRSGGGRRIACQAFGSPEYCCSRSFGSPTTCNPAAYAQLFKSACPRSYSTLYDDETAIHMCIGSDYTIRFYPTSNSFSTMKLGSKLESNDQPIFILGNFTLELFDEDYKYLGIWYTSDVESKKVWVANRDDLIVSGSMDHALSIDVKTGNLIITSTSSTLMHITDVDSFDHPTNLLLPGMKLGYDMTIGRNWTLTSWLSKEIPNLGNFTLNWEPIEETSQ